MIYINARYYYFSYFGKSMPQETFLRLAARASEIIDALSYGRAAYAKSQMQMEAVKKATAAQTEYLFLQGDFASYTGDSVSDKNAEELGSYKYTKKDGGQKSFGGLPLSPLALSYLDMAGLRFSGIKTPKY